MPESFYDFYKSLAQVYVNNKDALSSKQNLRFQSSFNRAIIRKPVHETTERIARNRTNQIYMFVFPCVRRPNIELVRTVGQSAVAPIGTLKS